MSSKQTSKNMGGRPPERGEPKRAAIALRTTPAIKDRLQAAAEAKGRSITQEVEARIEESFALEDLLGGPRIKAQLIEIAAQIYRAEKTTGKLWDEDLETYHLARMLIVDVIRRIRPRPKGSVHKPEEISRARMLLRQRSEIREALVMYQEYGRDKLPKILTPEQHLPPVKFDRDDWRNRIRSDEPLSQEDEKLIKTALGQLKKLNVEIDNLDSRIGLRTRKSPLETARAIYDQLNADLDDLAFDEE